MAKLKFAMVCSSNQNRSMEAHRLLKNKGLEVVSYGVGQRVKLPGQSAQEPNVYEFGTPYSAMIEDLSRKSEEFYRRKGLLQMLERNAKVKEAPERWQTSAPQELDVAVTFGERIMDQLLNDLQGRKQQLTKPLLVVNMDVTDNHEEAERAAPLVLKLCEMMEGASDLLPAVDDILASFQQETGRKVLHDICYN